MKQSRFNIFFNRDNDIVAFNSRTLAIDLLDESEYSVLMNIEKDNNEIQDIAKELYEKGYLIDDDCDEVKLIKYRLNKERYSTNTIRLTIAPTMNCNFKCSYCYEHGSLINLDIMNEVTQERLIEFIDTKTEECSELRIVWYGGEPLLAYEIIKTLSLRIIDICKKKGIFYSATIITNGYLLDIYEYSDFYELNIVEIQVTIDGPKKVHDARRMLKNGKETFSKIIDNVVKFKDYFEMIIRINIDEDNYSYLDELIEVLEYKKIFEPIINLSYVTDYSNGVRASLDYHKFNKIWLEFNRKCLAHGLNTKEYLKVPFISSYCDADYIGAFVIDSMGYLYKCLTNIGNPTLSVGNLNDLSEGNSKLYLDYMTYDPSEDVKCKECMYLPVCMGGCPYKRVMGVNDCTKFKMLIKDILFDNLKQVE